jgi:putative ABC transport system substrate-binding protein
MTIGLISTLALGLLAGPLPADAQQGGKVYRIGYIRSGSGPFTTSPGYMGLRQGLRELGYIEGQNLVIEYRWAEGEHERLPDLAAELVRLKVDVIVTSSAPPAIRAAQRATRTIPIVMTGSSDDPVKAGFVVSLARPGGNITGLTNLQTELQPKRLELLKEAFPRISRVAILWHGHRTQHQKQAMREIEAVGQALGIQIQLLDVGSLDEFERAFSAISREAPDALLVSTSSIIIDHRARIAEFAAKRRLPTMYAQSRFLDAGGLMSYEMDKKDLGRRAATYVDKILKGAKPADLPVEQPTKFDFVINLKTAKALGLTIPPEVLFQATKVIK